MKKALLGCAVVLVVLVAGLVGYAAVTGDGRFAHPSTLAPKLSASTDPGLIERGRYLVHGPAHCAQCHSTDDLTHLEKIKSSPLQGGLAFKMGPLGTRYARNLTPDPATGIGSIGDEALARTLRTGVMHDGELSFFMRYSASNLADEDIVAVMSYLRSLQPVRHEVLQGYWSLFGKVLITYAFPSPTPRPVEGPRYVPAGDTPSVERGEYLAEHVALCVLCHTATDQTTFVATGPSAGGSLPEPSHGDDTDMEFVAPNLTSHPSGMTGQLSEDDFVERLKGGRAFPSSIMPWESFSAVTDSDLRSIYQYLKSLPPVDRDVGVTYRKKGTKN